MNETNELNVVKSSNTSNIVLLRYGIYISILHSITFRESSCIREMLMARKVINVRMIVVRLHFQTIRQFQRIRQSQTVLQPPVVEIRRLHNRNGLKLGVGFIYDLLQFLRRQSADMIVVINIIRLGNIHYLSILDSELKFSVLYMIVCLIILIRIILIRKGRE